MNMKLPPTGITEYANLNGIGVDASVAADNGEFPRQDACYARPFDYTKIANDGTDLPDSAVLGTGPKDWACTRDNLTGLLWEVKTTSGLRGLDNTYTWYNSDPNTNGGDPGTASGGSTGSDTEKFVADVNAAGLCGHNDWRLPTVKEKESLANFGRVTPAIDTNYFPNTSSNYYFTSTLDSISNLYAWIVDGNSGAAISQVRHIPLRVQLVCGKASASPDYDITTVPGTAIDRRTNLMWQRFSVGQAQDGTGNAKGDNWAWALRQSVSNRFAGFDDWRVPNVKELRSIVDESRANPSINSAIFPNTPIEAYWTSSSCILFNGIASLSWTVGFDKGTENFSERYIGVYLRLVRDVAETPSDSYTETDVRGWFAKARRVAADSGVQYWMLKSSGGEKVFYATVRNIKIADRDAAVATIELCDRLIAQLP